MCFSQRPHSSYHNQPKRTTEIDRDGAGEYINGIQKPDLRGIQMNLKHLGKALAALAVLFGVAGCFGMAGAEEARNIAAECTYTYQRDSARNLGDLYNGSYSYYWQSARSRDPWLEVTLPEGETCSGVQIKWQALNTGWYIEAEKDGEWIRAGEANGNYLATWTPLPDVKKFRLSASFRSPDAMKIAEMEVYSAGERPASVQVWKPTPEKADLLMVAAHPDDEYVFLGALIPYYGAERGKNVLVCYITESDWYRRLELLDGLWTAGQRTYPLMGKFYDRYTMNLETAYEKIGKKKVRDYMIEVFRHYRPEVVVTHDIGGEYGHGVHKVCADIVINALEKSGDSRNHPESAEKYGTWEVPKCYLHLYEKDQIRFDWKGMKLEAFGGKSAFEAADAAWKCHVSQAEKGKYEVYTEGPYDSQVFGLYRSLVGEDAEHRDFFENLPGPEDFMVVSDGE